MAQSSDIKYFESGFLVITSGSSTTGRGVLGLQSISIDYNVDVQELTIFDNNFNKLYVPSWKSWSANASGVFLTLTGDTSHPQSGDTRFVNAMGGGQLLEVIKTRSSTLKAFFKIDSANYQTASCILTSYSLSAEAGSPMTFEITLQGTSELVKSST
jgi:hypothetical protein